MQTKTYEEAVVALIQAVSAATELDVLYAFIEHGTTGIREMTNIELQQEWEAYFTQSLELSDPESNPNGEGDELLY